MPTPSVTRAKKPDKADNLQPFNYRFVVATGPEGRHAQFRAAAAAQGMAYRRETPVVDADAFASQVIEAGVDTFVRLIQ